MSLSKRMLAILTAPAVALAAGAARADVFVRADIDKEKDITVDVFVDIDKYIDLFVFEYISVDAVAEQLIVKNQRNQFNFVEDENADALATIDGSVSSSSGIVLINQSPGFVNNQGNEVSVTAANTPGNPGSRPVPSTVGTTVGIPLNTNPVQTDGGDDLPDSTAVLSSNCTDGCLIIPAVVAGEAASVEVPVEIDDWTSTADVAEFRDAVSGVFVHAEVSVEQINGWSPNSDSESSVESPTTYANEYVNTFGSLLTDSITGSFADGAGVVGVNQASGSINNQNNALAIAIGDEAVYALGEADLGQFNTRNLVDVIDQVRTDEISGGSFDGFAGVAMVNQSSGSVNNQANVVDIAVTADVQLPFSQP